MRAAQALLLPLEFGLSLEQTATIIGLSKSRTGKLRTRFKLIETGAIQIREKKELRNHARMSLDERYSRDGLLIVEAPDGLLGAACVYPLRHLGDPEPVEANLDEIYVHGGLDAATAAAVRAALVNGFVTAAGTLGADVARCTVDDPALIDALLRAGFKVADDVRYYAPPRVA